jgi:resuscitation-promoting factor RpfB
LKRLLLIALALIATACPSDAPDEPVAAGTTASEAPSTEVPSPSTIPETRVPRLEGKNIEKARQLAEEAGLLVLVDTKLTDQVREGTVLRQSPKPQNVVNEGASVELLLAKALPLIPSVVGDRLTRARRTLQNRGFEVQVKKETSSQPRDTVISQNPAGGTSARPGRVVTIVVAKPPPEGGGGGNCTPGYSPCLESGPSDYDCAGGSGDGPAYTEPGVTYQVTGSDPYGLDADNDGYGCE